MNATHRKPDIGYIPTETEAIEAVLNLAEITPTDVVYDLGCGDGRIVIAAAQRGSRGVGIDIDPQRIQEAQTNATQAGVSQRVQFQLGDLYDMDFSEATVVFLYLLPHLNLRLLPTLLRQLKPGSRIVSRDFDMGAWKPDRTLHLQTPEEPTFYYWIIPE